MNKILRRAGAKISDKKPAKKFNLAPKMRQSDFFTIILYWLAVLSGLGLLMTIMGAIAFVVVFTAFSGTLPSPTKLTNRAIEQSTKIYDRNGELLYSAFNDKNRTLVSIEQVSPYLINATLAAEDAEFYKHSGLDIFGIARSVYINILARGKQGGSTITQQVAKNALLSSDRTITRKIKDVVLALQIERAYSKDQILQMYLNEVPYGGTIWGAEAASKTYFGKSAKDLTIAESALIAGLPQRPSAYSPQKDPTAAKNRQLYVLKLMHTRGWVDKAGNRVYLSAEDYNKAVEEPLVYAQTRGILKAPHFVMYVLDVLREKYGEEYVQNAGLSVYTTLDLKI